MLRLEITFDGGQVFVVERVGFPDLVALERQFDLSPIHMSRGLKLEHHAFLAWRGLQKAGRINGDTPFGDGFIDRLERVKVESATEQAPLEPSETPEAESA